MKITYGMDQKGQGANPAQRPGRPIATDTQHGPAAAPGAGGPMAASKAEEALHAVLRMAAPHLDATAWSQLLGEVSRIMGPEAAIQVSQAVSSAQDPPAKR
jgi:hypothetical protein